MLTSNQIQTCGALYCGQLAPIRRNEILLLHYLILQIAGRRTWLGVELATKDRHALLVRPQCGSAVPFESMNAHQRLIGCFAERIESQQMFRMLKRRRKFAGVL